MPESISHALPYLTGAFFGLALLLYLVAFRLFRRSRRDVFWRRRREAGQRGWHLFLVALVLTAISGISCVAAAGVALLSADSENTPAVAQIPTGTSTAVPTPTQAIASQSPAEPSATLPAAPIAPAPTMTTASSPTPIVIVITATAVQTLTPTLFPTFTPYAAPPVSSVTPRPNAQIVITALDDAISADLAPVNPRTTFAAGVRRIYLFVEFRGMTQGVLWRRMLYRDGELVDGNAYLWGQETEGKGYFFFGNDSGFEPGEYEIRLFIGANDAPISVMPFTIVPTS